MQRLPLIAGLAMLLTACAPAPVAEWSVAGTTDKALIFQVRGIVAAAQRLYPGKLDAGRTVVLLPEIDLQCFGRKIDYVIAGCYTMSEVYVKWPHPRCPAGADLTCSGLPHELCHLASGGTISDIQADACALEIDAFYRSGR